MSAPIIGFAGLTHLGLCSTVAAASKGFDVIGWHDDEALVSRIARGDLPVSEPDLDDLFAAHRTRISISADVSALRACDVVYIAMDVPTDDAGGSDLAPVEALIERVAKIAKPGAALVVLCQVPPGFTRARTHLHDTIIYQVETLVFGRAVERATLPERVIIGLADPQVPLPLAYRTYLEAFGCPLLQMRYESAELCKIAINCFLVASVSTTNALAELCEGIGAVWGEIAPALRLDRRIGQHAYLMPGLGISGGNLERDLATVVQIADTIGADHSVIATYRDYSETAKAWPERKLRSLLGDDLSCKRIGILGLAYKDNTHSTKNSPALKLIRALSDATVIAHDPIVRGDAIPSIRVVVEPLDVARGADALCLMTPWPQYRELNPADYAAVMKGRVVIDPYTLWDTAAVTAAGLTHVVRGR